MTDRRPHWDDDLIKAVHQRENIMSGSGALLRSICRCGQDWPCPILQAPNEHTLNHHCPVCFGECGGDGNE